MNCGSQIVVAGLQYGHDFAKAMVIKEYSKYLPEKLPQCLEIFSKTLYSEYQKFPINYFPVSIPSQPGGIWKSKIV